jgi:hypothetical protein
MKIKHLWAALALIIMAGAMAEDIYSPRRPLFTIPTEHFTFIFPEESRPAAEYLASMAEDIYDEVAGLLEAPKNLKIPVTFTPDSEELNGSFTPIPSPRIQLYQAPIPPNSGFALYNDALRKLFMHELTHAVSMTSMSPFWRFFSGLFIDGGISPAVLSAPNNFIEGVTVSFESRDGFGRANDTPYAAMIQQDIIEDRFKSFTESCGVADAYPGGIWYVYGGWFSRYLQETHGLEKYAALWKALGNFKDFRSYGPFKGAFEKIYGLKVEEAWEGFRQWMSIKTPILADLRPLVPGFDFYGALEARGSTVYFADSQAVKAMDLETGKVRKLFDADSGVSHLSLDAEGKRLLVSKAVYQDGLPRLKLQAYDLEGKRFLPDTYPASLREACFLPSGDVAAARNAGYTLDLILIREGGEVKTLFSGSQRLVPSNPCPWGDDGLIFILQVDGTNRLAAMDLATRKVSLLSTDPTLEGIRYLSSDGDRAYFSWDNDRSLFKLGILERESGAISFQATSLSGGVQYPVPAGEELAYIARMSRGEVLARLPMPASELADAHAVASWEDIDPDILDTPSVFSLPPSMEAKCYNILPWLLIPQIRYPLLELDTSRQGLEMLRSAGLGTVAIDPTYAATLETTVSYDWHEAFASWSLGLLLSVLPFDINLQFQDDILPLYDAPGFTEARVLGASATFSDYIDFDPYWRSIRYNLSAGLDALAPIATGDTAYTSDFTDFALPLGAYVGYSDFSRRAFAPNSTHGFGVGLSWYGFLDTSAWVLSEGAFTLDLDLRLPWLNLRTRSYGSMATSAGTDVGPAGGAYHPVFQEYAQVKGLEGPLYVFQESSLGYEFKTGAQILGGFYVESMDIKGGYRSAFSSGTYYDAFFAAALMDFRVGESLAANVPLGLGFEISYAFSLPEEEAMSWRILVGSVSLLD